MRLMQKSLPTNPDTLVMSWGDYFVEFLTCSSSEQPQFPAHSADDCRARFIYNPKNDTKAVLNQILSHPQPSLKKILVHARFFERFLSFSLGGSVGQLISPREKEILTLLRLVRVRQDLEETGPALGSSDLCEAYSFEEGYDSATFLKCLLHLKSKGARRLVVHTDQKHLPESAYREIQALCKDHQIELFPRGYESLKKDLYTSHLLDACLWGRFMEFKEELTDTLSKLGVDAELYFLTDEGIQHHKQCRPTQLINGFEKLLTSYSQKTGSQQVFEFGFEKFLFYDTGRTSNKIGFQSLLIPSPVLRSDFLIQPTHGLEIGTFGDIEISQINYGFDPGPVLLGRGQRVLVLDQILSTCCESIKSLPHYRDIHDIFFIKDKELKTKKIEVQNHSLMKNCSEKIPVTSNQQPLMKKIGLLFKKDMTLLSSKQKNALAIGPLATIMEKQLLKSCHLELKADFQNLNITEIIAIEAFR